MPTTWDSPYSLWDDPFHPWDSPRADPVDLLWTYDYVGAQTMAIHELLALELDDRLDDSETLRFTISATDPKAGFVLTDGLVRYKRRYYRVTKRNPSRLGARAVLEVEAEARWVDLAGRIRVGNFTAVDVTPRAGLEAILDGSDWTVGEDTIAGSAIYAIDVADASVLSLIRRWALITSTEVVFDSAARTVTLVAARGVERPVGFRYGWNLRGITRREEPPACTVLYAYGRNGLEITGANPEGEPFVEDFSFYTDQGLTLEEARAAYTRTQIWTDDSFVSDQPLYEAALERLARLARPVIAYEAAVVDLERAVGSPVTVELGDTVPVYDAILGIAIRARVVRVVERPLVPNGREIELAYLQGRAIPDSTGAGRGGSEGRDWLLFVADENTERTIAAGVQVLTDLGLQFSQGGEAVHFLDAAGTASGAGTLRVVVYDELDDVEVSVVELIDFADGDPVNVGAAFGVNGLQGRYLFSIRASVSAGSGTVLFAAGDVRYSILCRGGLGVTIPPETNSVTFTYNGTDGTDGTAQEWEVPPGVTSIVVDCYGAQGADGGGSGELGSAGLGGRIRARVPVTAGETLKVYVGGQPQDVGGAQDEAGFNGGGEAGRPSTSGGGGGGGSDVRRAPYALGDRLVVAGGGGGWSSSGNPNHDPAVHCSGGEGGYPDGGDGTDPHPSSGITDVFGFGGTQTAGGANGGPGTGTHPATDGALGQGGQGWGSTVQSGRGGGGGGGGLYGGGGGGEGGGGGGGSSGAPGDGATELLVENGVREGHGLVIISWDTPV